MSQGIIAPIALLVIFLITRGATDAAESEISIVRISGFAFNPESAVLKAAGEIHWHNQDIVPHTATADDHSWSTGELLNGEQAALQAHKLTTLDYFCEYHPEMRGRLILHL